LSNAIAVCLPIDAYIVEDDCPDPEGFRVVVRKAANHLKIKFENVK